MGEISQEPLACTQWKDMCFCVWQDRPNQPFQPIRKEILTKVRQLQAKVSICTEDQAFVKEYLDEWESFLQLSFDAAQLITRLKKPNVAKRSYDFRLLMLEVWEKSIHSALNQRVQKIVRKSIEEERNGSVCEPWLVMRVRDSYVNLRIVPGKKLDIYFECFEKVYFEDTRAFYEGKAQEYYAKNGVESYMKYAEMKIVEEDERAVMYLDPCSHQALMGICADVLVLPFKRAVLAHCTRMIERNEIENLQRMYRLMTLVVDGVSKKLEEYIFKK